MRFKAALLSACAFIWLEGKTAETPPLIEAKVKFISTTRPLVGVGIKSGKSAEHVVIPTDMFSDEVIYRGPPRLELFQLTAVPGSTPPEIIGAEEKRDKTSDRKATRGVVARPPSKDFVPNGQPPIAWIDLPANQGKLNLILLVTKGKDNGIVAINDPPGTFPPGSNRYLNLCDFPIKLKIPSGEQLISPGNSKVLRPGAKNNDYFDMQVFFPADDGDRLLFSSRVYHLESTRKLIIAIPVAGTDHRITLQDIEDRPAPAKGGQLLPANAKK
jgi:hypothetical protein